MASTLRSLPSGVLTGEEWITLVLFDYGEDEECLLLLHTPNAGELVADELAQVIYVAHDHMKHVVVLAGYMEARPDLGNGSHTVLEIVDRLHLVTVEGDEDHSLHFQPKAFGIQHCPIAQNDSPFLKAADAFVCGRRCNSHLAGDFAAGRPTIALKFID